MVINWYRIDWEYKFIVKICVSIVLLICNVMLLLVEIESRDKFWLLNMYECL